MAKKKNAPILRADGGGDVPPKTPVITKSYSVRDDWKDKGVVNYVAFKSVDGEVQDLTVNGQPAGGGGGPVPELHRITASGQPAGGGGGATATVLITNNNTGKGITVRGPIIYNNIIMSDMFNMKLWTIDKGSSGTYTVPLASGGMQIYIDGVPTATEPVITGGCTWNSEDQYFSITSDCTITI